MKQSFSSFFFKGISLIFHPVFIPVLCVLFYFSKTPRHIPSPIIKMALFSVIILTVLLPLLLIHLLKNIKVISSLKLENTKERIVPLSLNIIILFLILYRVFPPNSIKELHYLFMGGLISCIILLIMAVFRIKASIHMTATAGFFAFAIILAYYFKININGSIILISIILGAVGTSRLYLKAHTTEELIFGFLIGAIPQFFLYLCPNLYS